MLDVHPPEKPMHGVGDFFLHLFTITIGLLIAVGIEGAVTRHEHHKLAEEARATMTAEIRRNQNRVNGAIQDIGKERERLKANLASVAAVQAKPGGTAASNVNLDISFNTTSLENTAWRTAQATGALSYMPYDDAQKFSSIYEDAREFEQEQTHWAEDEGQCLGLIRRYLPNNQPLSKEGADAMAQEFGVWQGHLLSISIAARLLQEEQAAFLEGREPRHNLTESLSN